MFGIICSEKVTCKTDFPLYADRQAACKTKTFQECLQLAFRASALTSKAKHLFTHLTSQIPVEWLKISLDFYCTSTHAAVQHDSYWAWQEFSHLYSVLKPYSYSSICQRKPSLRGFGIRSVLFPIVRRHGKLILLGISACANETSGSELKKKNKQIMIT